MKDFVTELEALKQRVTPSLSKETPPLYLPWSQRVLNPFPLASSGTAWGDSPQPWAVQLLAFTPTVFTTGLNNATNYWTINLLDQGASGVAFVTTQAAALGTTRLSTTTFTQPASSNGVLLIILTATGAPGAIYLWPALALLRTGN